MIAVIELPSPRILKKKLKKYASKERATIYGLILFGLVVIIRNDIPFKVIPVSALIFCGISYEIIEQSTIIEDEKILKAILENYKYNIYTNLLEIL
ncbi:MAG: hypothetical protein ACRC41_06455 [Sarcina sp.]